MLKRPSVSQNAYLWMRWSGWILRCPAWVPGRPLRRHSSFLRPHHALRPAGRWRTAGAAPGTVRRVMLAVAWIPHGRSVHVRLSWARAVPGVAHAHAAMAVRLPGVPRLAAGLPVGRHLLVWRAAAGAHLVVHHVRGAHWGPLLLLSGIASWRRGPAWPGRTLLLWCLPRRRRSRRRHTTRRRSAGCRHVAVLLLLLLLLRRSGWSPARRRPHRGRH